MDISTQNTSNYHDQFLQAAVMVSLFSGALIALFPRDLYNDISSRPVLFSSLRKYKKDLGCFDTENWLRGGPFWGSAAAI